MNRRSFLFSGIILPFAIPKKIKWPRSVNLVEDIEIYCSRNGGIDTVQILGYLETKNTKVEVCGKDSIFANKYGKITEFLMPTSKFLDCDFIIPKYCKLEVVNVDFRQLEGYGRC